MDASATPALRGEPSASVERHLAALEAILGKILKLGGFELAFSFRRSPEPTGNPSVDGPEVVVEFTGPDTDLLLASGGSLLNALEYLVLRAVRLEENLFGRMAFDCEDFRRLRAEDVRVEFRTRALLERPVRDVVHEEDDHVVRAFGHVRLEPVDVHRAPEGVREVLAAVGFAAGFDGAFKLRIH